MAVRRKPAGRNTSAQAKAKKDAGVKPMKRFATRAPKKTAKQKPAKAQKAGAKSTGATKVVQVSVRLATTGDMMGSAALLPKDTLSTIQEHLGISQKFSLQFSLNGVFLPGATTVAKAKLKDGMVLDAVKQIGRLTLLEQQGKALLEHKGKTRYTGEVECHGCGRKHQRLGSPFSRFLGVLGSLIK